MATLTAAPPRWIWCRGWFEVQLDGEPLGLLRRGVLRFYNDPDNLAEDPVLHVCCLQLFAVLADGTRHDLTPYMDAEAAHDVATEWLYDNTDQSQTTTSTYR